MPIINGTNNSESLDGTSINDIMWGLDGGDTLNGKEGADEMHGGLGDDFYIVDNFGDTVHEDAGQGNDAVHAYVTSWTLSSNVERLMYFGPQASNFAGNGNALDNYIEGWNGNDTLDGKAGADTMKGLGGNDTYWVDNSGDIIVEASGGGSDSVRTTLTGYTLGSHLEKLYYHGTSTADFTGIGNGLDNYIEGWGGNDILDGGAGADTMVGLGGNDNYFVDNAGDVVAEQAGNGIDQVTTTLANYTLTAAVENLTYGGPVAAAFIGTGNALQNVITGANGGDLLNGGGGADTLIGKGGDDTYVVDSASDQVVEQAGEGVDKVFTSASLFTLGANVENLVYNGNSLVGFTGVGNALDNEIEGWNGGDYIDGKQGADTMRGMDGNDTYWVDNVGDVVIETAVGGGIDRINTTLQSFVLQAGVENLAFVGGTFESFSAVGNAKDNIIEGGGFTDLLDGGAGADTLIGGANHDLYIVDNAGDTVVELAGEGFDEVQTTLTSYTLGAHVENVTFTGVGAIDFTAIGNASSNTLKGGDGNDNLDGMGGFDGMYGGKGDDIFYVDHVGDGVGENPGEGNDTIYTTLNSYKLTYSQVENLIYNGPANTAFYGTGNAYDNYMEGQEGGDELNGLAGADVMVGKGGKDIYYVDNVGDVVVEADDAGDDTVRTSLGSATDFAAMYILPANVENVTGTSATGQGVYGNGLNNYFQMGDGADLIVAHDGGTDFVVAGGGNDFVYYGATWSVGDRVDGGEGFDSVGLLGDTTVTFLANAFASVEKLAVYSSGGAGTNDYNLTINDANVAAGKNMMVVAQSLLSTVTLIFNGSAETDGSFNVRGGKGVDNIKTGAGSDQLYGNLGADTLFGGGGKDYFEYYAVEESTAAMRDSILDFSAGDKINLQGIDADGNGANGNSKFAFIGSGAFTGQAGQLRAVQTNGSWTVEADVNGDGAADLAIAVTTAPGHIIAAADFFL